MRDVFGVANFQPSYHSLPKFQSSVILKALFPFTSVAHLTSIQRQERSDFVLNRLKRGFSFAVVVQMFAKQYGVSRRQANDWVRSACDYLSATADDTDRLRAYAAILELLHDQIVSYQMEIVEIEQEYERLNRSSATRDTILEELKTAAPEQQISLERELALYPEMSPLDKAQLVELKSVVRDRMRRAIRDLVRLRGLHLIHSDWRIALATLVDSNLIPTSVAKTILDAISEFDRKVQEVGRIEETSE